MRVPRGHPKRRGGVGPHEPRRQGSRRPHPRAARGSRLHPAGDGPGNRGARFAEYIAQENGEVDPTFSFLSKCAERLGVDMVEFLIGEAPRLGHYAITARGRGRHDAPPRRPQLPAPGAVLQGSPVRAAAGDRPPTRRRPRTSPSTCRTTRGRSSTTSSRASCASCTRITRRSSTRATSSSTTPRTGHGMIATGGQDCVFLAIIIKEPDETID